jgi:hypothetical protein
MQKETFASPKFAPKGTKTLPFQPDPRNQQLGLAIQLGDGSAVGPSKLGNLVRGQLPRQVAPPAALPPAPEGPRAQPRLAAPAGTKKVMIQVLGMTNDGQELVDDVELTFPPGTRVTDVQQTQW